MQAKGIAFGKESQSKMLKGMKGLHDAVASTLGPYGNYVILDVGQGRCPLITKDGVTVASHIFFGDRQQDMGAQLLLEAAKSTVRVAGDGTTTSVMLGYAMAVMGLQDANESWFTGREYLNGMKKAVADCTKWLQAHATTIDKYDKQSLKNLAMVCTNGEEEIAEFVAQAVHKLGRHSLITTIGTDQESEMEIVPGYVWEPGWSHPTFAAHSKKGWVEMENPNILVMGEHLSENRQVKAFLTYYAQHHQKEPLLLVSPSTESAAFDTLLKNCTMFHESGGKNGLDVMVVQAPGSMIDQAEVMKDMAIYVGASPVSDRWGLRIDQVKKEHLGSCKMVKIYKGHSEIHLGDGHHDGVVARIKTLQDQIDKGARGVKAHLEQRMAGLQGGRALIRINTGADVSTGEVADRIDDAAKALRAALEEGLVLGAGVEMRNMCQKFGNKELVKESSFDSGYQNVLTALLVISDEFSRQGVKNDGSIMDPVKVVRHAIQGAASVAGSVLNSKCIVYDEV